MWIRVGLLFALKYKCEASVSLSVGWQAQTGNHSLCLVTIDRVWNTDEARIEFTAKQIHSICIDPRTN
jgi:hypothetical protein